jgi:hypothetical protein
MQLKQWRLRNGSPCGQVPRILGWSDGRGRSSLPVGTHQERSTTMPPAVEEADALLAADLDALVDGDGTAAAA